MDTPNDLMRQEKRRKVSENHDWSKLCHDLLRPILESLSYIEFYRAKTVCSDWHSVWKTCVKPLFPWRIIYEDGSLMSLNPGEDKINKGTFVGLSDDSCYMASSGNWVLMVDSRLDFYIFNLLTRKRINLPSMESPIHKRTNLSSSMKSSVLDGHTVRSKRSDEPVYGERGYFIVEYDELGHLREPCRKDYVSKYIFGCKRSAVLWIDERTEDYVVAWIFKQHYLFTYKKGDDSWWNWNSDWNNEGPNNSFVYLAYKNNMLYLYTNNDHIKIIDFSGGCPKEVIGKNPYRDHPFHYECQDDEYIRKKRIAIQRSGEVLIILSILKILRDIEDPLFYVFKMNLESGKWERVDSIGDEMLIFGHGVTISAPSQDVGDGFKSGSIVFVRHDISPYSAVGSNCGIFDLATSKITWPKRFGVYKARTQWLVPGF